MGEEGRSVVETAVRGTSQEEMGLVKEVNKMQEGGGRKGKADRGRERRGKGRGERGGGCGGQAVRSCACETAATHHAQLFANIERTGSKA